MRISRCVGSCAAAFLVLAMGCGGDDKKVDPLSTDDASVDAGPDTPLVLSRRCTDQESALYADPGKLPAEKGAILACVDDGFVLQSEVQARLDSLKSDKNTYEGKPAEGGAHVYRVLYVTERGNGDAGYSVATVFLPEKPRAKKLPLLLLARGSRGQAEGCAPSLLMSPEERDADTKVVDVDNKDGRHVQDDFESMVWPLVAGGFAVIATDSAGYANFGAKGNPLSGYAQLEDMGKSFIDSGHALKKLVPDETTDDVLMVGLSQGGHTVLASLQVANDYKAPGPIKGAAVYAPLWFSQRGWGLVMHPGLTKLYPLGASSGVPVSIWYHYTHAEVLDGPGEGKKLFKPEFQDQIESFVNNICWSASYDTLVQTGVKTARELYDEAFADAASTGANEKSCDGADDPALCQKWLDRYRHDRPVLTGAAAKVPLVVAWGRQDTTLNEGFFQCGMDSLEAGGNSIDYCIDPTAGHAGVVLTQSTYVNEWLVSKALGTPIEAKCPENAAPTGLSCAPFQLQD